MHIFTFILLVSIFSSLYPMEQEGIPKERVKTSSYFMVLRRDMVAIYKGAVVQNLFLSACPIVNQYVKRHADIANILQESKNPVALFLSSSNKLIGHHIFDCETRERIDQLRRLLDPSCKPKVIKVAMSFPQQGEMYIELKDKENFLLGVGSYEGDVQAILEKVQKDFDPHMQIGPDMLAQIAAVVPAATQEKQKSWIKSLFKKGE